MVSPMLVAIATMFLVGGGFVILAGSKGVLPSLSNDDERYGFGLIPVRIGLAGLFGFVMYAATAWPVASLYGVLAGFLGPSMVLAKRRRREAIERVESIAIWVETLRDTMAASAGLQEALRLSASVAPAPIRAEVRDMAVRLQHQSVPQALRRFAGDMKNPLSDMVVASLILAVSRHAGSLRGVLAMTSSAARDTAAMWREVESGRSSSFQQARLAAVISLAIMAFMTLQRREFLEPFDSFVGQIALFVILGIFFASGVALHRMSRPVRPERMFDGIENWTYTAYEAQSIGEIVQTGGQHS